MKTTIAALIVAVAAASPAMAQEVIESGLPTQVAPYAATYNPGAVRAYASSPRATSGPVVQNGPYADPDPNIRLQLQNQPALNDR